MIPLTVDKQRYYSPINILLGRMKKLPTTRSCEISGKRVRRKKKEKRNCVWTLSTTSQVPFSPIIFERRQTSLHGCPLNNLQQNNLDGYLAPQARGKTCTYDGGGGLHL